MTRGHMKRCIILFGLLMLSWSVGAQDDTVASSPAPEAAAAPALTNAPEAAQTNAPEAAATEQPAAPAAMEPPAATPDAAPAPEAPAPTPPEAPETAPAAPVAPPSAPEAAVPAAPPETPPAPVVETAAPPAIKAVVPEVEPTPVDARELSQQEELRRKALEIQAAKSAAEGDQALRAGDYAAAAKAYDEALKAQPEGRPNSTELRVYFRQRKTEAYVLAAEAALKKRNLEEARNNAKEAQKITRDDKRAQRVLERADKEEKRRTTVVETPPTLVPIKKQDAVVKKKQSQKQLLDEGRQYFEIKDYDNAEARFDKMLLEDPYNVDAMRFLRRIADIRYDLSTKEREATVADMMNRVRDTWNPHTRKESSLPLMQQKPGTVEPTDVARTREKLKTLIIPSINFSAANINDVMEYLSKESVSADPEHVGVNIIIKQGAPEGEPAAAPGAAPAAPAPAANTITLNLRKVSMLDAIKFITEYANMSYRIDKNVVIILPKGYIERLVTRLYPVSPSTIDAMVQRLGEAAAAKPAAPAGGVQVLGTEPMPAETSAGDLRTFFDNSGVPFPQGTSIRYNKSISKLIVANTPENLEKLESLLAEIDVASKQVEIETRFVEIQENFLEQFGLQWTLTDNFELATKSGPGSPLSKERIQINKDSEGLTKGLRFFNNLSGMPTLQSGAAAAAGATPMGNILTFASVLTNPELQMVINAISQSGNTDVLSAPRVTTKAGEQATIKVVKEIRYPQSYEPSQIQIATPNGSLVGGTIPVTVFAPADFQTREIGVILNVTPTVGPDGYTIDLTLVPEVTELVEWHQYGTQTGSNESFNAEQPFFSTRTITSKLVVWDGETVVMGGLITESLTKNKDKIPILGDIPLIGRLFRSEGEFSQKKNLMIFVTARIVDSSGRPIHKKEKGTTMRQTVESGGAMPR